MIQVNKEFLRNEGYIKDIITTAEKSMREKQRRYNRYTRKTKGASLGVPIEYYIVNIASGFFGGIAPEITVKQEAKEKTKNIIQKLFKKAVGKNANKEEFQIFVDHLREYNDDSSLFYQMVKDYFITGSAYALQYETTENKLVYARVSPLQTVALYDYNTPINEIGILRKWQEADETGKIVDMIEIITNEEKIYYRNGRKNHEEYKLVEDMTEKVVWKLVPAMSIENPDGLAIFSVVEDLIDSLETIIQNNKETFSQNADAKLVAIGYSPENDRIIQDEDGNDIINPARIKEDQAVLNAKMLYVDGDAENRGDFKWLLKELNDTASENHKKTLIDLIFMIAGVPNVSDVGFTNADNSSALEKKFFPLEQIIIQAEKQFKKEYLELFENFTDRINLKHSTNFDFSELDITFKRNLPANEKEVVDTWLALRGLISDETIISKLPFELDVETELAKLKEEDEVSIMKFSNMEVNDELADSKQEAEEIPQEIQE